MRSTHARLVSRRHSGHERRRNSRRRLSRRNKRSRLRHCRGTQQTALHSKDQKHPQLLPPPLQSQPLSHSSPSRHVHQLPSWHEHDATPAETENLFRRWVTSCKRAVVAVVGGAGRSFGSGPIAEKGSRCFWSKSAFPVSQSAARARCSFDPSSNAAGTSSEIAFDTNADCASDSSAPRWNCSSWSRHSLLGRLEGSARTICFL